MFTELNIGYVLLVSKDKCDGIYDFYDDNVMHLQATYKNDERIRISNMKEYMFHNSDFYIHNFVVKPENLSRYEFLFVTNKIDNGYLSIDGKMFYKPSIYVVKDTQTRNGFVDNLVFNQYDDNSDLNKIRFFLHKAPSDSEGLQNHPELLSMLKEYLIEKKD